MGSGFRDPVSFVKAMAKKERQYLCAISCWANTVQGCVIALTGPTDYISDGHRVFELSNGHEMLGRVTGSGCIVGTAIASYCGASYALEQSQSTSSQADYRLYKGNSLIAAITGCVAFEQ